MAHHHDDDHDLGLAHDLPRLLTRRAILGLAGASAATLVASCGSSASRSNDGGAGGEGATAASSIPEETAGPYPGDGSNGPNVLTESGVVRQDITRSFGGASGTASGIPATVELTLLDIAAGGKPLAGAAVYLWHCDAAGRYTLYDAEVSGENYCRGVQESGSDGRLTFRTVFPAAYPGRWPHMHFEVYESLDAATSARGKLRTSQLAIPKDACDEAYATEGYEQSAQVLAGLSLDSDMVFADGYASQLASVSGSADEGYTMKLNVGV